MAAFETAVVESCHWLGLDDVKRYRPSQSFRSSRIDQKCHWKQPAEEFCQAPDSFPPYGMRTAL